MTTIRVKRGVVVALALAVVACDAGEDRAAADREPEAARQEAMQSAPSPLVPIDHSGVTGTALADRDETGVTVTLSVEGLEMGAPYLAYIHAGRCAAAGPAGVPLGRITADEEGMASAELRVGADEVPAEGAWSVQIQAEAGEAGEALACANILPR